MLGQLSELCHIVPSQNESPKRWKRDGKKLFGYICTNIPEETIYAADILPVSILGPTEPIVKADRLLATFVCYPTRSSRETGLNGKFADLDGTLMAYSCEGGKIGQQVVAGAQESVDVSTEARHKIRARTEKAQGAIPAGKHRLLFMGNPSCYALGSHSYIRKYGAVFVCDPVIFNAFCNPFSPRDLEQPYERLAREYMGKWLNFSYDKWAKWQDFFITESKVGAVVSCGQKGCKASSGSPMFLRDGAAEQRLPTLWREMEQADPEGYDPGKVA